MKLTEKLPRSINNICLVLLVIIVALLIVIMYRI
jgi:hypothetical protein